MMYIILGKSFSRYEQKKLRYGALFGFIFLAFNFYRIMPDFALNYQLTGSYLKMLSVTDYSNDFHMIEDITETNGVSKLVCNTNNTISDMCEMSGDIRIDSSSASVLIVSFDQDIKTLSWEIKPYARKDTPWVGEWTVKSIVGVNSKILQCNHTHEVPAILFSIGGFSGNLFHDFDDILIPLYFTAREFNGKVKLLTTDHVRNSWWEVKYHKILKNLSGYEVIKIDEEKVVHCFQSAIVGLNRHDGDLRIDSSRSHYTIKYFTKLLKNLYSLPKISAIKLRQSEKQSPMLLIIARNRTRIFINAEEIGAMAKELGFTVVIAEPNHENELQFLEIVNSCDVMMGVHGAGLTNMLFLPENAVMIQVVPFGVEWVANCYGNPTKNINVRYLEYRIELEESTLIEQYPPEHEVLSNPDSIAKQGWGNFSSIYLKQNVKVKLNRFRPTLLKALELLHQ